MKANQLEAVGKRYVQTDMNKLFQSWLGNLTGLDYIFYESKSETSTRTCT